MYWEEGASSLTFAVHLTLLAPWTDLKNKSSAFVRKRTAKPGIRGKKTWGIFDWCPVFSAVFIEKLRVIGRNMRVFVVNSLVAVGSVYFWTKIKSTMVVLDQHQQPISPTQYGTFGERLVAGIIDGAVLTAIFFASKLMSFGLVGGSLIAWLYYAITESSSMQASFGKSVMGLAVTDIDGSRIDFWRASGRYLIRYISYAVFLLGIVIMFMNPRRQCLHDWITNTVVIKRQV